MKLRDVIQEYIFNRLSQMGNLCYDPEPTLLSVIRDNDQETRVIYGSGEVTWINNKTMTVTAGRYNGLLPVNFMGSLSGDYLTEYKKAKRTFVDSNMKYLNVVLRFLENDKSPIVYTPDWEQGETQRSDLSNSKM